MHSSFAESSGKATSITSLELEASAFLSAVIGKLIEQMGKEIRQV